MERVKVEMRNDDGVRWVRVVVSLDTDGPCNRYPKRATDVRCEIRPLDSQSTPYTLDNWQSGLVSGIAYGFRAVNEPFRGITINEISGALGAGDMTAIANAGGIAVAALLEKDYSFAETAGWHLTVDRLANDDGPATNGAAFDAPVETGAQRADATGSAPASRMSP